VSTTLIYNSLEFTIFNILFFFKFKLQICICHFLGCGRLGICCRDASTENLTQFVHSTRS